MRSLKVCFFIPGLSDGGAQKQCIYLLNELQRRTDVTLHLIYFHTGVYDGLLDRERVNAIRIPVKSNYDPRNMAVVWKVLRDIEPDILVSWLHACDVYSFVLKHSVKGMRWLMTERDSHYPRDVRYWLRRKLGIYADAVISNSQQGDKYWQRAGAKGRRFVVSNIVYPRNDQRLSVENAETLIIFVGRLEPQKNPRTVVRAFCQLSRLRSDCRFSVIGEGALRSELEAFVRSAGVRDKIEFIGFQRDVGSFMSRASVIVNLSHHEGLPNVVLEGVASGVPIVASDIQEHRDVLGEMYPYYVRDRYDVAASVRAIEKVLDSDDAEYSLLEAKARLGLMAPGPVTESYMKIFRTMAAIGRE